MLEYQGFPIEQLLRHRRERQQLKFAVEAVQRMGQSEECAALPSVDGLRICAINEEALGRWVALLSDIYGDDLRVGEPRVRYIQDESLYEPIMHVRMQVRQGAVGAVQRELQLRDARIVEHCPVERIGGAPLVEVIRVVAPLTKLIGLQKRLDQVTDGSAIAVIALSHYEAVPVGRGGARGLSILRCSQLSAHPTQERSQ